MMKLEDFVEHLQNAVAFPVMLKQEIAYVDAEDCVINIHIK